MSKAITSIDEVYQFIRTLKSEAEKMQMSELANELDDALHLGSSGMEILGGIKQVITENEIVINKLIASGVEDRRREVLLFVDKAFGR